MTVKMQGNLGSNKPIKSTGLNKIIVSVVIALMPSKHTCFGSTAYKWMFKPGSMAHCGDNLVFQF